MVSGLSVLALFGCSECNFWPPVYKPLDAARRKSSLLDSRVAFALHLRKWVGVGGIYFNCKFMLGLDIFVM